MVLLAFLMSQMVKNLPAVQETWVRSLGREDLLEKGMTTHSSILAWRIRGQMSVVGYSPWGLKELDMIEWLTLNSGSYCIQLVPECTVSTLTHQLPQSTQEPSIYFDIWTEQMSPVFYLSYFLVHRTITSPTLPVKWSLLNTLNALLNLDIRLLFSSECKVESKSIGSNDQLFWKLIKTTRLKELRGMPNVELF